MRSASAESLPVCGEDKFLSFFRPPPAAKLRIFLDIEPCLFGVLPKNSDAAHCWRFIDAQNGLSLLACPDPTSTSMIRVQSPDIQAQGGDPSRA